MRWDCIYPNTRCKGYLFVCPVSAELDLDGPWKGFLERIFKPARQFLYSSQFKLDSPPVECVFCWWQLCSQWQLVVLYVALDWQYVVGSLVCGPAMKLPTARASTSEWVWAVEGTGLGWWGPGVSEQEEIGRRQNRIERVDSGGTGVCQVPNPIPSLTRLGSAPAKELARIWDIFMYIAEAFYPR